MEDKINIPTLETRKIKLRKIKISMEVIFRSNFLSTSPTYVFELSLYPNCLWLINKLKYFSYLNNTHTQSHNVYFL